MKKRNTVALILYIYAIVNFIACVIVSFAIGDWYEAEFGIIFFALSVVVNFGIYALGEIIQILHDIRLNTSGASTALPEDEIPDI